MVVIAATHNRNYVQDGLNVDARIHSHAHAYIHWHTASNLQLHFQLMDTLRVRAYLYVSVFVCVSIFSSWSLGFRYQYFQQWGELCIKLCTLYFDSRISLSLQSICQSHFFSSTPLFLYLTVSLCVRVYLCVCVFGSSKLSHSFVHSRYYFKCCYVWICYTFFRLNMLVCVSECVCMNLFCVLLFLPLKHQLNLLHEYREQFPTIYTHIYIAKDQ